MKEVTNKLADIAEGKIDADLAFMLLSTAMRIADAADEGYV
jgi:hypothetical protein